VCVCVRARTYLTGNKKLCICNHLAAKYLSVCNWRMVEIIFMKFDIGVLPTRVSAVLILAKISTTKTDILHEHLTSCVSGRLSNTSRSILAERNTFTANVVEMSERHLRSIHFVLRVCHVSRPVRTLRSNHCTMLAFSSLFCCSFSSHVT